MNEATTSAASDRSPSAIRNATLPRSLRGFDEDATRRLLGEVAAVVESLIAERDNLRRHVESLQAAPTFPEAAAATSEADESPEALGKAILAAKHAGEELIETAQQEATRILADAAAEADRLAQQARASMEDVERELARERAELDREREDHRWKVGEWSAKVEAEREEAMTRARSEAEAVLATQEQILGGLRREEEKIRVLISEKRTQFAAMLQVAIAELEPLEAGEPGDGDLPDALRPRVGSATHNRG
jgi:cell division septum initiation protein DivIVA